MEVVSDGSTALVGFFCVEGGHYYSSPESVDYAEVVIFCIYQMFLTKKKKKSFQMKDQL